MHLMYLTNAYLIVLLGVAPFCEAFSGYLSARLSRIALPEVHSLVGVQHIIRYQLEDASMLCGMRIADPVLY